MSAALIAVWFAVLVDADLRTSRLPNSLMWPGVVAVTATGCAHPVILGAALAGCLGYLVAYGLGWCGGGDVKLSFVLGGLLADPAAALLMVVFAQLGGLSVRRGRQRWPHGPALIWSAIVMFAPG